ncbi:leucine-rich repeat-containing protein [Tanacetum coccineum]|uniref:Leucine-rich repeat-containing protein n=1 Tax=Tanacetum coccineum TaxID=301880 RepID=A0ABQ5IZE9_9ASTR
MMMSWNTSTDCCNWVGVFCDDSTGDVIKLDLFCGMLQGTIHPNTSLFNLPHLQKLNLAYNYIDGPQIPSEIARFSNSLTHLNLSGCWFSGQVSTDITLLHKLVSLDLSYNSDLKLRPHVFINLIHNFTNLEELSLGYNEIARKLSSLHFHSLFLETLDLEEIIFGLCKLKVFPNSFRAMKQLEELDLPSNEIHGPIPHWVGEIGVQLNFNDMGNDSFEGTIPDTYEYCGDLRGLSLNGNQLKGEVPSSLSKCSALSVLDLGNNYLNGTFPSWLGGQLPAKYFQNFNSMKNVVKNSTTPKYLSMGVKYYSFIVAVKGVNQDFPQISVDYTIIDMSNNKFEGQIPNVISGLNSLIVLNLSHNNLIGPIPQALGNLTEIESLDLSWNQLSGEIPQSLARITTLEVSMGLHCPNVNIKVPQKLKIDGNLMMRRVDLHGKW